VWVQAWGQQITVRDSWSNKSTTNEYMASRAQPHPRLSCVRFVSAPHAAGSVPVSRLPCRLRYVSCARDDQDAGIEPLKLRAESHKHSTKPPLEPVQSTTPKAQHSMYSMDTAPGVVPVAHQLEALQGGGKLHGIRQCAPQALVAEVEGCRVVAVTCQHPCPPSPSTGETNAGVPAHQHLSRVRHHLRPHHKKDIVWRRWRGR
jgi:hypothetical protein